MARTAGSKDKTPRKPRSDKKDKGDAAGPGHNSKGAPQTTGASTLTDDEQRAIFVNGLAEIEVLVEEKDKAVARLRNRRQQLEARGFSKEDVDFGLALRKGDDKAIVKKRKREQQIARWLNHPVAQLDLFVDGKAPGPIPIDDEAFAAGEIVGMEGKPCTPPTSYAPQTAQRWIEGWHKGQAALQAVAFRGKDSTLVPASQPATKKDQLDDDILADDDRDAALQSGGDREEPFDTPPAAKTETAN